MKVEDLHLALSPLTDTIYVGTLNKKGDTWLKKKDVTNEFITAVIQKWSGYTQTLTDSNGDKHEISIKTTKKGESK